MKYVVVLGDGMSDHPVPELGGRTPLQAARTPAMDWLAQRGELGLARTIPPGMPAGSDTANLAVMGYDPRVYYTGRSPFEAASMGVQLSDADVAFRCNLVTLSDGPTYAARRMLDHSADEITSEEARPLIQAVQEALGTPAISFYPGVGYRHLMTWRDGPDGFTLTPPHDILGREVKEHLPAGPHGRDLLALMERSATFLADHPVNQARRARGLKPANSIWIWADGRSRRLPGLREKYGLRGSVVAAVDLVKGIGLCAGLRSVPVPGATGTLHTNYIGKAGAALAELADGQDFVYVHVEAPDECGHRGEIANKVLAIERVDGQVLQVILDGLSAQREPFRVLLLPDHATPLRLRTHTDDPVPFVIYDSTAARVQAPQTYDETAAERTGLLIAEGHTLMDRFIGTGTRSEGRLPAGTRASEDAR